MRCLRRGAAIWWLVVSDNVLIDEEDDTDVGSNVEEVGPQTLVESAQALKPTQKSWLSKQRSSIQKWSFLTLAQIEFTRLKVKI